MALLECEIMDCGEKVTIIGFGTFSMIFTVKEIVSI